MTAVAKEVFKETRPLTGIVSTHKEIGGGRTKETEERDKEKGRYNNQPVRGNVYN